MGVSRSFPNIKHLDFTHSSSWGQTLFSSIFADIMGNLVSKDELSDDLINLLIAQTGFNKTQIHRLYIRYQHLDKDKKGYLVTEDLLEIPQVKFNPVSEKIIETFLPKGRFDLDGKPVKSGHITFSQFARTFSVFQPIRSRQSDDVEAPNSKE